MRTALCLLLLACGGVSADDQTGAPMQDVELASGSTRARNWCCVDADADGRNGVLLCGAHDKGDGWPCYCSGVVSTSNALCDDRVQFTPGTVCTGSPLVCW